MFKKIATSFKPCKAQLSETKIVREVVDSLGRKTSVVIDHVPDSSVKPDIPPPETFSLEASIASGKNLKQVSSLLPGSSDTINNGIVVEAILNHADALATEAENND